MELPLRTLLRLHVEAVWRLQLPAITGHAVRLQFEEAWLPWKLYAAELADEQITLWRADVAASEREALLIQAREALAIPPTEPIAPHISREIALHLVASPTMSIASARSLARQLTSHDRALVEAFEPGEVEYYFHPDRRPLIGVVVAGRLLSLAHSSRRTARACELGIDTLPEARRKGYALAATILWAAEVAREKLVPFYSAFAENTASLALAAAAGYRTFARAAMVKDE